MVLLEVGAAGLLSSILTLVLQKAKCYLRYSRERGIEKGIGFTDAPLLSPKHDTTPPDRPTWHFGQRGG